MSIDISYIVSAYDRPLMLPVCLWSLAGQIHQSFEVIMCDNSRDKEMQRRHRHAVLEAGLGNSTAPGDRFRYVNTARVAGADCYASSEYAVTKLARGSWLCFPCDDCYYVPEHARQMLLAAIRDSLDMVYCDVLVGPLAGGGAPYHIWETVWHSIPKTAFIIRREAFPGWCERPKRGGISVSCDYQLARDLKNANPAFRLGKLSQCLLVHS